MTATTTTCRSCGAPIRWAVTGANNKPIPIDPDPHPDGNIELVPRPFGNDPSYTMLDPYAKTWGSSHTWPPDTPRHRSHFASCPNAAEHRRTARA